MPRRKPTGRPNGRTKIFIDWNEVDELLEAGGTGVEVASYYGIHPNTFYDKVLQEKGVSFTEYQQLKREKGIQSLKLDQYKLARKGDRAMLIWLGKQRLGQRDDPDANKNHIAQTFNELKKAAADGTLLQLISQD